MTPNSQICSNSTESGRRRGGSWAVAEWSGKDGLGDGGGEEEGQAAARRGMRGGGVERDGFCLNSTESGRQRGGDWAVAERSGKGGLGDGGGEEEGQAAVRRGMGSGGEEGDGWDR
ncbi:hypothetical protein Droror1_Dr00026749 [Drosera rotundifolia]